MSPTTVPQNGQATFTWSVTRSDPADTRPIRVLIDRITNSGADVCAGCPESGSKTITIFHAVGAHEAILLIDSPVTVEVLARAPFTVTEAAPASPSPSPTPPASCPAFSRECAPPTWTGACDVVEAINVDASSESSFTATASPPGKITSVVVVEPKPPFVTLQGIGPASASAVTVKAIARPTAEHADGTGISAWTLTLEAVDSAGNKTRCSHVYHVNPSTQPVWLAGADCGRTELIHPGGTYDLGGRVRSGAPLKEIVVVSAPAFVQSGSPTYEDAYRGSLIVRARPTSENSVLGEVGVVRLRATNTLDESADCVLTMEIGCPLSGFDGVRVECAAPTPTSQPSPSGPLDLLWGAVCPLVQGFLGLFGIDFACPSDPGFTRLAFPADATVAFAPFLSCEGGSVAARVFGEPTRVPLAAFTTSASSVKLAASWGRLTATAGNPATGVLILRPTVVDAVLGFGRTSTVLATARAGGSTAMCPIEVISTLM